MEFMGNLGLVSEFLPIGTSSLRLMTVGVNQEHLFHVQYAPYLRAYSTALGTVAFEKVEGSSDEASELLKRVWNVSIGQEA